MRYLKALHYNRKAYQLVIIAIRAIPSETKYIIIDLVKLPTQLEPTKKIKKSERSGFQPMIVPETPKTAHSSFPV